MTIFRSPRRFAPRPRGWQLLVILAFGALLPAGVAPTPAAADAGDPPPETALDCELVEQDGEPEHWRCTDLGTFTGGCLKLDGDLLRVENLEDAETYRCTQAGTGRHIECDVINDDDDLPDGTIICPLQEDWFRGEPPAEGTTRIECRNEIQLGWDDSREVAVPENAPQWWLDEVENESADRRAGFEGRGETEEYSDDTKNLTARGCDLAEAPPAPEGMRNCQQINEAKAQLRPLVEGDAATPAQVETLAHLESRWGGIIPDDCWGTYPTERYTITWNPGSAWTVGGWAQRLTGWLSMFAFGMAKMAVQVSLWMVRVAFDFDMDQYKDSFTEFAGRVDRDLIHFGDHDLSFVTVVWFVLLASVGFMAMRDRLRRAGAEVLATIVLAGMGTVLLGPLFQPVPEDPEETPAFAVDGYMDSFGALLDQSSYAPLLIAHGRNPDQELDRTELEALLRRTHYTIHHEFIEVPAAYLNWGTEDFSREPHAGATQSCAEVHDNILSVTDPPRTWPAHYMARHQCLDEAEFNSDMPPARLASVVLVSAVAILVSATLALTAMALLLAKVLGAILFAMLPLAVVAAILPANGRKLAWWWLGALVQVWLASLAMGSVLLLLQFGVRTIVASTSAMGMSLAGRWMSLLVIVAVIFMLRKKLIAATQRAADNVTNSLSGITAAGEPGNLWQHPVRSAPLFSADAGPDGSHGDAAVGGSVGSEGPTGGMFGASFGSGGPSSAGSTPSGSGGMDLSMVDRGGAAVAMAGATAGFAAAGAASAVAGTVASVPPAIMGVAVGRTEWEHDRARNNMLSQAYRAALSETEDVRSRQAANARAGLPPYEPVPNLPAPTYKRLPTDKQIARLKLPVKTFDAMWATKRGLIRAPNSETLYRVRYSSWRFIRPRSWGHPIQVRSVNGGWVGVKPRKVLRSPWLPGPTKRSRLGRIQRRTRNRRHLRWKYSYRNSVGPGPDR